MYTAREIGRSEWITAHGAVEAHVNDLRRRLARMTRNDALNGFVGNGAALRTQWNDLNLTRQHAIVQAVLDHATISRHPGHANTTPTESTSTGVTSRPETAVRSGPGADTWDLAVDPYRRLNGGSVRRRKLRLGR